MKTPLQVTTRTFKSGNSIAVRIPREFNIEAGKTLEIKRRGKDLLLVQHPENLGIVVDILQGMPADFFAEGRVDPPPQERDFSSPLNNRPKSLPSTAKAKSKAKSKTINRKK